MLGKDMQTIYFAGAPAGAQAFVKMLPVDDATEMRRANRATTSLERS